MSSWRRLTALICGLCWLLFGVGVHAQTADTEEYKLSIEKLVADLDRPWGLAFLSEQQALITERPGRLWQVDLATGKKQAISGLPKIKNHGQGGLLDVALHPQFEKNTWVYLSYAARGAGGFGTQVLRGRLVDKALQDVAVIFVASGKTNGSRHFGSRLVFDREGYLYVTVGDRGQRSRAQDVADHAGSVMRLHDDGRPAPGNLFQTEPRALPEIYSYGHRNPQGMTLHPETGEVWLHEHGPRGGDELNLVMPHRNYGWPVITYGEEYSGGPVGAGWTEKPGLEQPLYYWVPSIAPSGMSFYQGDLLAKWQGDLLLGSLKFQQLVRLRLQGTQVVHEERLLTRQLGRIRDVRVGPDGAVYLLTDSRQGALYRLSPAK